MGASIMLNAWNVLVSQSNYPDLYQIDDRDSMLAKNLYNAAMFRIRQTFTGWDKTSRTDHENEVFEEIRITKQTYPGLKIKRVLSYKALDKILRVTKNPDYFAGLPMQTAEAVVHQAVNDFSSWLKALRDYKKNPTKYTGKPRMPKYRKGDRAAFVFTNQDAVLYHEDDKRQDFAILKIPGVPKSKKLTLFGIPTVGILKQITVTPMYGRFMMSFIMEINSIYIINSAIRITPSIIDNTETDIMSNQFLSKSDIIFSASSLNASLPSPQYMFPQS